MISKRLLLVLSMLLVVGQWTMAWNESDSNQTVFAELGIEAESEIETEEDGPNLDRWLLGFASLENNFKLGLPTWGITLGPWNRSALLSYTFKRYLQFHNLKLDC